MATANVSRWVLVALMLLALVLTAIVAWPFVTAFFFASVLAAALAPPTRQIARFLGGRRRLAAGFMTLALVVAVLAPLGGLGAVIVKEIVEGIGWLRQALQSEGITGLVERLPHALQQPALRALAEVPHGAQDLQALVTKQAGRTAAAVGGVLSTTGSVLLQTVLMLIAVFFLLIDGRALVEWVKDAVPLKRGQMAELLEEFRKVIVAVLVSTVATAGVQAVLSYVGYLIGRVPTPIFFALLTFVLALVPAVGATIPVVIIGVLQFLVGHKGAGVFLILWGLLVVGLVDNFVKPLFIRGGLEIHGAIVFFALLGGLAAFGPVGLVAGPLVVSFLIAVVRMYRRDYGGPH